MFLQRIGQQHIVQTPFLFALAAQLVEIVSGEKFYTKFPPLKCDTVLAEIIFNLPHCGRASCVVPGQCMKAFPSAYQNPPSLDCPNPAQWSSKGKKIKFAADMTNSTLNIDDGFNCFCQIVTKMEKKPDIPDPELPCHHKIPCRHDDGCTPDFPLTVKAHYQFIYLLTSSHFVLMTTLINRAKKCMRRLKCY